MDTKTAGERGDRSAGKAKQRWRRLGQTSLKLYQGLAFDKLTLRSMSLSFASLLSMVPLLAFSFSVLKGFGAHNYLEPMLDEFLAPMGEAGAEIGDHLIAFVENINVGVLGFAGLLILIFTVISLVQKIEDAFNYIWYVPRSRTLVQRLRDYLSIMLIGPLVIVCVVGLITTLRQAEWMLRLEALHLVGPVLAFVLQQMPLLLVFAAFTFFYAMIPNTRVEWTAALGGAAVSGVLWLVVGWAFTNVVASSAKYTAIYSGFAMVILFLIWLNLNWLIILIGSAIAFYLQFPAYLQVSREVATKPSPATLQKAVLQSLVLIERDHRNGNVCWNDAKLAKALCLPHVVVKRVTAELQQCGLLVKTEGRSGHFLPGRASNYLPLADILGAAHDAGHRFERQSVDGAVLDVIQQVRGAGRQTLDERTLADLVDLVDLVDRVDGAA